MTTTAERRREAVAMKDYTPIHRRDCLALLLGFPISRQNFRELKEAGLAAEWGPRKHARQPERSLTPAGKSLALGVLCDGAAEHLDDPHVHRVQLAEMLGLDPRRGDDRDRAPLPSWEELLRMVRVIRGVGP